MWKTYKHKKRWWKASRDNKDEGCFVQYDWHNAKISAKLIENSDDWELQEEKDWIEGCAIKIWQVFSIDATPETDVIIDIIDWCVPKITKKELEEADWVGWEQMAAYRLRVIQLLKDKWLYKE